MKPELEKMNVVHHEGHHHVSDEEMQHGDRGLKMLGEDTIELTEDDVSDLAAVFIVPWRPGR